VQNRTPSHGGILAREDFASALGRVSWTTEPREDLLPTLNPKSTCSSKLGNWKTEEYSKFVAVAPTGIIPEQVYECFVLLVRIYSIEYSLFTLL
jgi:hypothetical protein